VGYLAESAKPALLGEDLLRLNGAVKAVLNAEGMRYSFVTDSRGIVRAHSDPGRIGKRPPALPAAPAAERVGDVTLTRIADGQGGTLLHLVQPVTFRSKLLGEAHVGYSLNGVERQVREETLLIGLLSLLILGFGVLLAIRQGGALLRPFSAWLASSPAGGAAREYRVQVRSEHAFEDLAASFDSISRELAQKLVVERSFGRYVNPGVLELIQANPEETWLRGTRNEASVLFTDVRGFTGIAEAREPESVVEALNEYFAIATAAIVAEGGTVDKYIGDGVLAVFGVPGAQEDHALRAVKAAVTMQKDLRRRARNSLNPLLHRIGIGVNSGVLVAGNIGSADKMEYTVVGDCVNVASRLNGLAQAGEVVISETVAAFIPRHLVTLSEMEPRQVKGKRELVRAFKVLKTEF
jgi:adenylate cyclase